jgi:predicted Fe-Mo cluster-binding NifX family protein
MSYKIALASTDGKVVNTHFGHAQSFHIVEIEGDGWRYVETRDNEPTCHDFSHNEDALAATTTLIGDCDAVVVAQIGPGAAARVIGAGIRIFESTGLIDEVLQAIIDGGLLEQQPEQQPAQQPGGPS